MRTLYAALLLLYPAPFRRRYDAELLAAFDAEHRAVGDKGAVALAGFWRYLIIDLLASASRQRYRAGLRAFHDLTGTGTPHLPDHPRRSFMETLVQDVRYALRQFARRPGFTAIAVLSLALGIGGNSLIFGLLDGFVFTPFPYPDADRLVAVGGTFPKVSAETTLSLIHI